MKYLVDLCRNLIVSNTFPVKNSGSSDLPNLNQLILGKHHLFCAASIKHYIYKYFRVLPISSLTMHAQVYSGPQTWGHDLSQAEAEGTSLFVSLFISTGMSHGRGVRVRSEDNKPVYEKCK